MSIENQRELSDPEICSAAKSALAATLSQPGMNEFRALYVALRMIGELMDSTGARVAFGHAAEQTIRELAGEEDMRALRDRQALAHAMARRRREAEELLSA